MLMIDCDLFLSCEAFLFSLPSGPGMRKDERNEERGSLWVDAGDGAEQEPAREH